MYVSRPHVHRRPRRDPTPAVEEIVLTPADLCTARAELALAFLTPLLEAQPPLPVKMRERLTTVQAKLARLVQVLRQAEAGRPRPGDEVRRGRVRRGHPGSSLTT